MFLYKNIQCFLSIALVVAAFLIGRAAGTAAVNENSTKIRNDKTKVVVLDAGHGGRDSGKVGINKSLEKDINLSITKKLKEELKKNGIEVVMTRTKDQGEHKAEDLKKRVEIINNTHPDLAVSIHQNSYPKESIKGAQVFYYKNSKEGERAAIIMQENLKKLDPANKRCAKADNTYYILKKTKVPVIIVECGFLSNWEEAEKLNSEDYQRKAAQTICEGVLSFLDQGKAGE